MARIKVRMELNPGGIGVRYRKLALISSEFEKLFRYLASDLGVQSETGDWLAVRFGNASVCHDVELAIPVADDIPPRYNEQLDRLVQYKEDAGYLNGVLKPDTLKQFITAGQTLDADEYLKIGLYGDVTDNCEWRQLTKAPALELKRVLETKIEYLGTVQGKTGSWFKSSRYFDLYEILSGAIVKCYYTPDKYAEVLKAYQEPDSVVHVSGMIIANRMERRALEVRVSDVRTYAPLSDEEFRRFYGMAPGMTGDLSTEEYIDRLRDDGEA